MVGADLSGAQAKANFTRATLGGIFRAIWINEIVINGLEIRPYGIESVVFDEAGPVELEFRAVKPGRYVLQQPGARGDGQRVQITIQ